MAQPLPFRQWKIQVKKVAGTAPMEAVTKLQRQLVLLAMGAAIVMPGGGLARITGVVARTPVDEGRARASWQVSVGRPGQKVPPEAGSYKEASAADALQAMSNLQPGQTVWISSALPYIVVLEFGGYPNPPKSKTGRTVGGFSRQAPQGMVRVTFEDLTRILTEAAA